MKRSEVNAIMRDADAFIRANGFHLPPFAYWTPEEWQTRGEEVQEIVDCGLGWDITDFGLGQYETLGLLLFTIRNGRLENLKKGKGKIYAEKIMIINEGQKIPTHFHRSKTEDIINRGGGKLCLQIYNANEQNQLLDTDVTVSIDGVRHTFKAGDVVTLTPGESITLLPFCAHNFWAEDSRVLAGEVSSVNDDQSDNFFIDPVARFPTIEEDEAPLFLLIGDYPTYYHPHGH